MRAGWAAVALAACLAHADELVRNWFGDPYFQVRSAIIDCPVPLGPFTTHDKMLHETHYRSERGTRCWLEGRCAKPNSYLYDPGIAAAVRKRFDSTRALKDASLWVTVQRRFVWVEGCVSRPAARGEIEQLLRRVPDMELLTVFVSDDRRAPPPYRVLEAGQRRAQAMR